MERSLNRYQVKQPSQLASFNRITSNHVVVGQKMHLDGSSSWVSVVGLLPSAS